MVGRGEPGVQGALLSPSQEPSSLLTSLVGEVKHTHTKVDVDASATKCWDFHKLNAALERNWA